MLTIGWMVPLSLSSEKDVYIKSEIIFIFVRNILSENSRNILVYLYQIWPKSFIQPLGPPPSFLRYICQVKARENPSARQWGYNFRTTEKCPKTVILSELISVQYPHCNPHCLSQSPEINRPNHFSKQKPEAGLKYWLDSPDP